MFFSILFNIYFFGRMTVTSKRPENILLKRPPVPRAASSHEGLAELATNSDVRGRGVPSMISPEGMSCKCLNFKSCCTLIYHHRSLVKRDLSSKIHLKG